ncbi:MAG: hypothetical protein SF053_20390 [Bacteroidia bacterium]|nr:hypothetical protein [Bacteroidia bacterium]
MSFSPAGIIPERLERVLEEGYPVRMGHYLSRAWQLFRAEMGSMLGYSALMLLMLLVILGMYAGTVGLILGSTITNPIFSGLMGLPLSFLTVPVVVGYWFVMQRTAYDQPSSFGNFFDGFQRIIPIGITQILVTLFTYIPLFIGFGLLFSRLKVDMASLNPIEDPIGYQQAMLSIITGWELWLGIIPAAFVACLYLLAQPLVCLDNLSPWEAMETSRKLVSIRILPLVGVLVLTYLLFIVGMIVFLIPSFLLIAVSPALGVVVYILELILIVLAIIPLGMGFVYAIYEDITAPLRTDVFQQDLDEIGAPDTE